MKEPNCIAGSSAIETLAVALPKDRWWFLFFNAIIGLATVIAAAFVVVKRLLMVSSMMIIYKKENLLVKSDDANNEVVRDDDEKDCDGNSDGRGGNGDIVDGIVRDFRPQGLMKAHYSVPLLVGDPIVLFSTYTTFRLNSFSLEKENHRQWRLECS